MNVENGIPTVIAYGKPHQAFVTVDTENLEEPIACNSPLKKNVEFDVIAVGKEDGLVVGTPVVEGAKVAGKVLKNGKGKKITVFTYRSKKDSKRKMGHRQPYTKVEITAINA